MKYDLVKPCKNCPFGDTPDRIIFANRERAEEIEETAYRNGFPCHLSAVDTSDEDPEYGGFVEGENTQHCAGAMMMYMKQGESAWPGVANDEEVVEAAWERMDFTAPVFECTEDFFAANEEGDND